MPSSHSRPVSVAQLAEEFLARQRKGERPDVREYTDRYPDAADEIREVFAALAVLEDLKPSTLDVTGTAAGTVTISEGRRLERLGDFRILREIGRGGMGIVYEAEQESLGRRVALKVLPSQSLLDPQQQKRFRREAKAAAKMHHTNIVPVYGVGEHDGLHYYVMQYIQGLGLDQVMHELKKLRAARNATDVAGSGASTLDAGPAADVSAADVALSFVTGEFGRSGSAEPPPDGPPARAPATGSGSGEPEPGKVAKALGLPPRAPSAEASPTSSATHRAKGTLAVSEDRHVLGDSGRHYWQSVTRLGIQVAEALDYAHGHGILHRDIKPSNLLLDTHGNVWVTDFGLAKAVADEVENLTHTGDIVGTLRYMAPERFSGQSDARGDIYSLGLTLYEMITLRPAFPETDRNKLMSQVTRLDPLRPRKVNPAIPRDLETIVLKAIDREPGRRYASAGALAEDLKRFLDDKPIRARPSNPAERLWRWCRRNPVVAGLSAALLFLLVTAAVGSTAAAWRFQKLAGEERLLRVKESVLRAQADQARYAAEAARAEAMANLAEAERQRQRAEANFRQARQAVDDSLTKISESNLLAVAGMQPLRKELLESALKYYEDFLREHANDPALQKDLATAYSRVGKIRAEIGSREKALEAYQRAFQIRSALLKHDPDNPQLQAELAFHHQAVGRIERLVGDRGAALKSFQEASRILQALVARQKDSLELLSGIAGVLDDLGAYYEKGNQPLAAMSYYAGAVRLQRQLIAENARHPQLPALRFGLAEQLRKTGRLNLEIGLHADALKQLEEARGLLQGLLQNAAAPEQTNDWQRALAACLESIGDVRAQQQAAADALRAYREALPLRERLAADNPAVTDYQNDLARAYYTIGTLRAADGQAAAAAEAFQRAIERQRLVVIASPRVEDYTRALARQQARLGAAQWKLNQPAEVLRSYQEARASLRQLSRPDGDDLYELAAAHAACAALAGAGRNDLTPAEKSQRQADGDQAVQTLRRALAAGFRDVGRLRKGPEWDALRQRTDYQVTVRELEQKSRLLAWEDDFEAAKARAAREKKDLFVYFSGSDWCGWCLLVKREVLDRDAFIEYAAQNLVLVELDFPRYKPRPRHYARNDELFRKWGLHGFPSLVLTDSQGRAYANLREGKVKDEAAAYVKLMTELQGRRRQRDGLLAQAAAAEGLEKAKLLDQALRLVPTEFISSDYGDAVAQVLEADAQDRAGLRSKYAPLEVARRQAAVRSAMDSPTCDWGGTVKQIDAMIDTLKPSGKAAADMLADRARARAELKQWDLAEADWNRAVELQPDDPDLRVKRGRFHEKRGHADKARADFSRAVELHAKRVEALRAELERAPEVIENREALSAAYATLIELQRSLGRPLDAAATARERGKLWPGHARQQYNVACEIALSVPLVGQGQDPPPAEVLARRQRLADEAMDVLRQSILDGFNQIAHMRQDTDLDPLRRRNDYQALERRQTARELFGAEPGDVMALRGHTSQLIEGVAFAPDGKSAASSGYDNTVRLWDLAAGKELRRFEGHQGLVQALAFSADGTRLVTGGRDKTVRLWDVATGKELRSFAGHEREVTGVALSADGKLVLAAGRDKTVRVWDAESGKEALRFDKHTGPVMAVALVGGGRHALSAGYDSNVWVWDVRTGAEVRRLEVPGGQVWCAAVTPDGKRALTGTMTGGLYLWDLEQGRLLHRLQGHWDWVRGVAMTADGRRALSCSARGESLGMLYWDLEAGRPLHRFAPRRAFGGVALAPDGGRAVTANTDGAVHVWSLAEEPFAARDAARTGLAERAEAAYARAVERRPDDWLLRLERGRFFGNAGRWREAVADLDVAIRQRADREDLFLDRARCYAGLREWDKVAADCAQALAVVPGGAAAGQRRAPVYDALARWEGAVEKVAALRPKDTQVWITRGRLRARLGRWQPAAEDYAKVIDRRPLRAEAVEYACLLLLRGEYDGYQQFVKRLADRAGQVKDADTAYTLARAVGVGPKPPADAEQLLHWAKQGAEGRDKQGPYLHALGLAHLRAGHVEEAVKILLQSNNARWGNATVVNWYALAVAYQRKGDPGEARRWREKADAWLDKAAPRTPDDPAPLLTAEWLEANVLRREAEAVLKGAAAVSRK